MRKQLHMVREGLLPDVAVTVPEGYVIRALEKEDETGHIAVMHQAGFVGWNEKQLHTWKQMVLPGGIVVALHEPEHAVAATAMASHRPTELHPDAGELGWVAASPRHAGKGLGQAVCAAALGCFREAGYRCVYLMTDDHRLAAIKIYLRLGFVPFLFASDMRARWEDVLRRLNWPSQPDSWVRAPLALWVAAQVEPGTGKSGEWQVASGGTRNGG